MAGRQALALLVGVRILLSQPTAPGAKPFLGLLVGISGVSTLIPRMEFANANSQATEEPMTRFSRHPPSPKTEP
jgi:hypothetical protein